MFVIAMKPLKGSTIVEVVTGVLLIALGMSLAVIAYTRTMENSNLYVRHQAVNAINELIIQQTKTMNYQPVEVDTESFRVTCVITPFEGNNKLKVITYSATLLTSSKTIYERKIIKRIGE